MLVELPSGSLSCLTNSSSSLRKRPVRDRPGPLNKNRRLLIDQFPIAGQLSPR
jgi:hypothetical protein